MATSIAIVKNSDAHRRHERWLRRPDEWLFWRIPQRAFRVPLPSVWGLEPVRRLAASLELRGRICAPVPPAAFHSYEPAAWYREWLRDAVEVDDRAAAGSIELFPELLGRQSPVASPDSITNIKDPQAQVRALSLLAKEVQALLKSIENRWSQFSIEWSVCRTLIDVCKQATEHDMSIVVHQEWPEVQESAPTNFSTMTIRGFHRIREAQVIDDGEVVEVKFVNGKICRLRAETAFPERTGVRISRARVGHRRGTVVLSEKKGDTLHLTPHRILHLCDPAFSDE